MFSKKFTWVNMAVSVVGYVCWAVWFYHRFDHGAHEWYKYWFYTQIIPSTLSPLLLSAILTLLLLHLDRLSCCCSWTRVPGEVTSVYDPTTDKRMILENGELVEPPEETEVGSIQIVKCITDELISDVVVYEFVKAICHDVRVIHEREV